MQLLTKEIRDNLPPLYRWEQSDVPMVHAKFFTPNSGWPWYETEGSADGDDFRFFGYVVGLEREWGYFMLWDLMSTRGPLGLPIVRDMHFMPRRFSMLTRCDDAKGSSMFAAPLL